MQAFTKSRIRITARLQERRTSGEADTPLGAVR